LIGDESFHVVSEFVRIGKMPQGVNTSYVKLVPKNAHPTKFMEFRPISLIHGVYKIVGKLLLSRIRPIMTTIIGPHQTAFISGRQILDGFMIANEVIYCIKKGGQEVWFTSITIVV
jgi:hypothetical protein